MPSTSTSTWFPRDGMSRIWKTRRAGSGTTTDTWTERMDTDLGATVQEGARPRHTEREHYEFATRTYLYPGAAADPGRRVVGDSGLAVQDSKRDGHGSDHGHGSRGVPGNLGRDDDRDDVSHGCPDDPGLRAGPAGPDNLRARLWTHVGLHWR